MSFCRLTSALVALAVALPLLASSAQAAPPAQDLDGRFEAMLRQIDVVPSRYELESVWPDARARLLAAARDDARDQFTRSRALTMLSHYPEPAVRTALVALAAHPDFRVRRVAIYTAARTFGVPGDATLVALVEGAAREDVAPAVRDHAIRGLRWIDHAEAGRALDRIARDGRDARAAKLARRILDRRAARLSPKR
ncbi:MAG: hypothetical protein CSA66_05015 [Proteobacteria bacterium]|nr:MAG: hypothetical protein CSA66_05015 [Pseudomonadota bacterium]